MKLSIYSSAFNVIYNGFDYLGAINNFCSFADEVVISVNTSNDGTLDAFLKEAEARDNLKIEKTFFSYDDPDLDGKIKNHALQHCSSPYCIGLDMDERIPLNQKELWIELALALARNNIYKSFMIPVVDLYRNKYHFISINQKWYLHKREGAFRGTVAFAKNQDGTHDIGKSDSCELIDKNGNLITSYPIVDPRHTNSEKLLKLQSGSIPFVLHLGWIDLERRAKLNQNFWKKHWSIESGKDVPIAVSAGELEAQNLGREVLPHNLELDI